MANTKIGTSRKRSGTNAPTPVLGHGKSVLGQRGKKMTWQKYDAKMREIIFKHDTVADALIEMVQFSANVEIINDAENNTKRKCK
jgi:hypothetical protein